MGRYRWDKDYRHPVRTYWHKGMPRWDQRSKDLKQKRLEAFQALHLEVGDRVRYEFPLSTILEMTVISITPYRVQTQDDDGNIYNFGGEQSCCTQGVWEGDSANVLAQMYKPKA